MESGRSSAVFPEEHPRDRPVDSSVARPSYRRRPGLRAADRAATADRGARRFFGIMDLAHIVLLVAAGLAAGVVNAIAGGGSLITFPSLIAVGLPSVAANVSNSTAVFPGYVASVVGSRADLAGQGRLVRAIVPTSLVGAVLGCLLLLGTPARAFEVVVPFLVLGAAAILFFQDRLRGLVGRSAGTNKVTVHAVVFVG